MGYSLFSLFFLFLSFPFFLPVPLAPFPPSFLFLAVAEGLTVMIVTEMSAHRSATARNATPLPGDSGSGQ